MAASLALRSIFQKTPDAILQMDEERSLSVMPIRCYSCMEMVEDENLQICPYCKSPVSYESKEANDLIAGSTVKHRYVIGRSLGHGGNAITYIALDTYTNQRCAIKECFPQNACKRDLENNETVLLLSWALNVQMQNALKNFSDEIALMRTISGADFSVSYLDSADALKKLLDAVAEGPTERYLENLALHPESVERKLVRSHS
jgi:serine/threonine protein kinase